MLKGTGLPCDEVIFFYSLGHNSHVTRERIQISNDKCMIISSLQVIEVLEMV